MMTAFLVLVCLLVGFTAGSMSLGGILLIPPLQWFAGLTPAQASATALCSFVFTGLYGAYLHWRHGSLRRDLVVPQCIGALVFSFFGALTKYLLGPVALNRSLAVLIILSGLLILKPVRTITALENPRVRFIVLIAIGGFAGYLAGLTGMGGPLVSIPIMIITGFHPFATVAAAQPFMVVAALSGTVGNALLNYIDWPLALMTVGLQAIGVWAGVRAGRHLPTAVLKTCLAIVSIGTGVFMLVR